MMEEWELGGAMENTWLSGCQVSFGGKWAVDCTINVFTVNQLIFIPTSLILLLKPGIFMSQDSLRFGGIDLIPRDLVLCLLSYFISRHSIAHFNLSQSFF